MGFSRKPQYGWVPPKTGAFRSTDSKESDLTPSTEVTENLEGQELTILPVGRYEGIELWDYLYDLPSIPLFGIAEAISPLLEDYLGEGVAVSGNWIELPGDFQLPLISEYEEAEVLEDIPALSDDYEKLGMVPNELEWVEKVFEIEEQAKKEPNMAWNWKRDGKEEKEDPTRTAPIKNRTPSFVMAQMKELLENDDVLDAAKKLALFKTERQGEVASDYLRAGDPEIAMFCLLRNQHYLKSGTKGVDEFTNKIDKNLDSLGFPQKRLDNKVSNTSLVEAKNKVAQDDQVLSQKAKAMSQRRKKLIEDIVEELIGEAIKQGTKGARPLLTKFSNFRRMLESTVVLTGTKYKNVVSGQATKNLMKTTFDRMCRQFSIERVVKRWTANLTTWIPSKRLQREVQGIIDGLVRDAYADVNKRFDSFSADVIWQQKVIVEGMDKVDIVQECSAILSALEAVEIAMRDALYYPERYITTLQQRKKEVKTVALNTKPKNLKQQPGINRGLGDISIINQDFGKMLT